MPPIKVLGFCIVVAIGASAGSQAPATRPPSGPTAEVPAQLLEELASIRDAALQDDYAYRQLSHLTENIGPRPSGSAQAEIAARYVADALRDLGLEVRLEPAKVPHWVRGIETAELVEYSGQVSQASQKVVVTALGGSTATPPDGLTAPVVAVRNFEELSGLGRAKVEGKIVLFTYPFDEKKAEAGHALDAYAESVVYRASGARAAAELGAVASLVRSAGGADYRLPHTGWSAPAGIPAGAVTAEDAELISHLAAQGPVRMHLTLTPQSLGDTTGYNVVADLKGSEQPEKVVVVSGHLDSWDLGTGALDDGAGVVVAMETAEVLQHAHFRPKRTIRVIAWMDEENGGAGSRAYTDAHAKEFANHVAAIESDLGAAHPLGFDVKMSRANLELLRPVQEVLAGFGANVLSPVEFSPGADLAGMAKSSVPTLGIMQDGRTYFNYHHTSADTLDKVDPQSLRENAAAMAVMAYALANMNHPLTH